MLYFLNYDIYFTDKLIPDESAETQPDDCPTFVNLKLTSRPKSENINAVSNLLFSEISDSTLCPNSPYKTIQRNHVLGGKIKFAYCMSHILNIIYVNGMFIFVNICIYLYVYSRSSFETFHTVCVYS